jgi:hypothetical protein
MESKSPPPYQGGGREGVSHTQFNHKTLHLLKSRFTPP